MKTIEYDSYEDACNDPELELRIIWQCNICLAEREDYPNYNEGGSCECGGSWNQAGTSYNA